MTEFLSFLIVGATILSIQKIITILEKSKQIQKQHTKNKKINYDYQKNYTYKNTYKENIKKGINYEKYIGKKFEENGYIVKYNGIEQGKKDSSIDLIAIKGNQLILTQCKNWKENSRYKINHEKIKAFIGDSYTFLTKNPQYQGYKIKRLFCVANDIFDKSAKAYLNQNRNIIDYRIINPD